MTNNTVALAVRRDSLALPNASLPAPSEWQTMTSMAETLIKSGLLPQHVKTPQAALAIMLKGREIGAPAMYALSNIAVIQGKPTCNAELMAALIYRDQGDDALQFVEATNDVATIAYRRRGWSQPRTYSFSIDDAKRAGLSGGNWQKYPAAMLRARCISAVARMAFADTIGGMYTPEELGAPVTVEDGEHVVYAPQDVPQPRQERRNALPQPTPAEAVTDDGEIVEAVAVEVEPAEFHDADSILQWLDEVTDRRELRHVKEAIEANSLSNHPQVKAAYTAKWEQLTGKRAPSRDEMVSTGQASFVK